MDLILALKLLGGIVGFFVGMVLASLISAIWLRLAAEWLRFANIPYGTAFKSALLSNLVNFGFNLSIGVNYGITMALGRSSSQQQRPLELTFAYNPIYFLYATIFGLIVTAVILCRTIPNKDSESRISFGDSFALASLYFALSFVCMLLLGLVAFCILMSLMNVTGAK